MIFYPILISTTSIYFLLFHNNYFHSNFL